MTEHRCDSHNNTMDTMLQTWKNIVLQQNGNKSVEPQNP